MPNKDFKKYIKNKEHKNHWVRLRGTYILSCFMCTYMLPMRSVILQVDHVSYLHNPSSFPEHG